MFCSSKNRLHNVARVILARPRAVFQKATVCLPARATWFAAKRDCNLFAFSFHFVGTPRRLVRSHILSSPILPCPLRRPCLRLFVPHYFISLSDFFLIFLFFFILAIFLNEALAASRFRVTRLGSPLLDHNIVKIKDIHPLYLLLNWLSLQLLTAMMSARDTFSQIYSAAKNLLSRCKVKI